MQLDMVLPWPMSQGSYYNYNRRVKHVTNKGKAYQRLIAAEVFEQCVGGRLMEPPIEFLAVFYPPNKRIWDFDNHLKALQDSLTLAGVWVDDSAIAQAQLYRGIVVPGGKVVVRLKEGGLDLPLFDVGSDVWDLLG